MADFQGFWDVRGAIVFATGTLVDPSLTPPWAGNKGLFVTGQSRRTLIVATASLLLAVLNGFRSCFGPKKTLLGHKMRSFGRAPPDLAPPHRGATGEFLAQTWYLARAPPRL